MVSLGVHLIFCGNSGNAIDFESLLLDREPKNPDLIERNVKFLLRLSTAARGLVEVETKWWNDPSSR